MDGAFSVHEEMRNTYKILIGKPGGKKPLGRPRQRWEDNFEMYIRKPWWDDVEWTYLTDVGTGGGLF
jgi:hypothetical protein